MQLRNKKWVDGVLLSVRSITKAEVDSREVTATVTALVNRVVALEKKRRKAAKHRRQEAARAQERANEDRRKAEALAARRAEEAAATAKRQRLEAERRARVVEQEAALRKATAASRAGTLDAEGLAAALDAARRGAPGQIRGTAAYKEASAEVKQAHKRAKAAAIAREKERAARAARAQAEQRARERREAAAAAAAAKDAAKAERARRKKQRQDDERRRQWAREVREAAARKAAEDEAADAQRKHEREHLQAVEAARKQAWEDAARKQRAALDAAEQREAEAAAAMRESKRRARAAAIEASRASMLLRSHLRAALDALSALDTRGAFAAPLARDQAWSRRYFALVAKPMDFATIRANIEAHRYKSFADFRCDVVLVFANAEGWLREVGPCEALTYVLRVADESYKALASKEAYLLCSVRDPDQWELEMLEMAKKGNRLRQLPRSAVVSPTAPRSAVVSPADMPPPPASSTAAVCAPAFASASAPPSAFAPSPNRAWPQRPSSTRRARSVRPTPRLVQPGAVGDLDPRHVPNAADHSGGGGDSGAAEAVAAEDDSCCVVCRDGERTHALVPCGHVAVCGPCGALLAGLGSCPLCSCKIESCLDQGAPGVLPG